MNDKVFEELRTIEEKDGVLKPEAVVNFAKNKKTALHGQFDWDDANAGHKYRLWQARQLIRICVEYLPNDDNVVETHAFVHFEESDQTQEGYVYIKKVLADEYLTGRMLSDALRELKVFRKKYEDLKEIAQLKPVFDAIDSI